MGGHFGLPLAGKNPFLVPQRPADFLLGTEIRKAPRMLAYHKIQPVKDFLIGKGCCPCRNSGWPPAFSLFPRGARRKH
jgi:hypothetical protein